MISFHIVVLQAAITLGCAYTQAAEPPARIIQTARDVRQVSYPELAGIRIRFRSFRSRTDFFQTRFGIADFLRPGRMRYVILVNESPALASAPGEAVSAILAHELEHIRYYQSHNRWLLAGLIRLLRTKNLAAWERQADRGAIRRGYGPGLRLYRLWLYDHIPLDAVQRKRRIYLTPEAITACISRGACEESRQDASPDDQHPD